MEKGKSIRQPESQKVAADEMTEQELDEVAGGIIVIGGKYATGGSVLNQVAINPQPLPPRIFKIGSR